MALLPQRSKDISELYGYPAADRSPIARHHRRNDLCPFLGATCTKVDRQNRPTGVCSVFSKKIGETIVCPNRLYFGNYTLLADVAADAFGPQAQVTHPSEFAVTETRSTVVALGHRFGKEVRIPIRRGRQFYTDWVLARIDAEGAFAEYLGLEVQSIDTTGNYRDCRQAYMDERVTIPNSQHGLNWENVNKRIIPQIIYKARVLQREELCQKGLYVAMPQSVYQRLVERLGGELQDYPAGRGAITFLRYSLAPEAATGQIRPVQHVSTSRTSVDALAERFTTGRDLPTPRQVEEQIRRALGFQQKQD